MSRFRLNEWRLSPRSRSLAARLLQCTVEDLPVREEASYLCDACGEEIVVPIDLSAGQEQEYVEDCPVCCRPNVVHVEIDEDGEARVWAERE